MANHHSTCIGCSEVFTAQHGGQRYCTTQCREAAKWRRTAKVECSICHGPTGYKLGEAEQATCNPCRRSIRTHDASGYRKGCRCDHCREAAAKTYREYQARRSLMDNTPRCNEPGCTTPTKGHGLCVKHLKRKQKAEGTWKPSPSDAWDSPARIAKYKRRKAILRGTSLPADSFTVSDLIARDGARCALCQQAITDARYPDPLSASIDHIVPISRGGQHLLINARATHLRCNIIRSNQIEH